jgi:hypothetical protein
MQTYGIVSLLAVGLQNDLRIGERFWEALLWAAAQNKDF